MKEYTIVIHSLDDVRSFVNMVEKIDGEVTLSGDDYILDAKKMLGIFCLDWSKSMRMTVKNWKEEYSPLIDKYVA